MYHPYNDEMYTHDIGDYLGAIPMEDIHRRHNAKFATNRATALITPDELNVELTDPIMGNNKTFGEGSVKSTYTSKVDNNKKTTTKTQSADDNKGNSVSTKKVVTNKQPNLGGGLYEWMVKNGMADKASFSGRKAIAANYMSDYTGTAAQNNKLLKILQQEAARRAK